MTITELTTIARGYAEKLNAESDGIGTEFPMCARVWTAMTGDQRVALAALATRLLPAKRRGFNAVLRKAHNLITEVL